MARGQTPDKKIVSCPENKHIESKLRLQSEAANIEPSNQQLNSNPPTFCHENMEFLPKSKKGYIYCQKQPEILKIRKQWMAIKIEGTTLSTIKAGTKKWAS